MLHMHRWVPLLCSLVLGSALLTACAGATPPADSPAGAGPGAAPNDSAAAVSPTPFLVPEAVPPPPAACAAMAERAAASTEAPDAGATCGADRAASLQALADAVAQTDRSRRDAALAALEGCSAFPVGLLRALRAELGPVGCGDALIAPLLSQPPAELSPDIRDALLGLAYAAELTRLVRDPPVIAPPFSKARFGEFLRGPLGTWILAQANAVNHLSLAGNRLQGYGKGVAAVEAGLADMRFVEVVREVPLPEELARDQELSDAYYMALDEALDPRKHRGRAAALVGLRILADIGVLHDPRVDRARALLSKLYSGRRIDRLDGLLLPLLPEPELDAAEERLAATLPAFYSGILLARADATDPRMLRALLERGIAPVFRTQLEATALPLESRRLYARALVGLGQRYWRSADFVKAAQFSELGSDGTGSYAEEARLLGALASALRGGPRDAAEMMLRGPFLPAGVGNVAKLDSLAKARGPMAALAAYDAAFILEMVPPREADPLFWDDLARRFDAAGADLEDAEQRREATAHAQTARETAQVLRQAAEQDKAAKPDE